ncbi:MAG TPA: NlpC/P60 family protein [Sedimentisphaerales bacterium]|nr:NlpC/P60 family protein [Sedimentisphaerales bacterium]
MAASLSHLVKDLIGVPFVDDGRDGDGLDCWGLVMLVRARMGRPVADFRCRCDDTQGIEAITAQAAHDWRRADVPQPGDLVAITADPRMPEVVQHFGVYIGDGRFIHATARTGVMVARTDDRFWGPRIAGYYRQ